LKEGIGYHALNYEAVAKESPAMNRFEKKVWAKPSIDDFAVADVTHTGGTTTQDSSEGTNEDPPSS